MAIPEELGGLGASMVQRIKAQERLAQGCGATALAINMHFNVVGLLIDLWRKFKDPKVENKLRQIAAGRLICGGAGVKPLTARPALVSPAASPPAGECLISGAGQITI